MSAPKNFYAQKMDWLVEVAAVSGIAVRTLAAAIACADASFPPGEVKKKQRELAARLGKPQSAISQGCADLFRMGFLSAKQNGNRTIYALDFDVEHRKPPQKRALKGKLRSSAGADSATSAAADIAVSATPDIAASDTNIRTSGSALSAPADEHYNRTLHKGDGEEPSTRTPSSIPLDMAGAPDGARLHGCLVGDIEEAFGRPLLAHHADLFAALIELVGKDTVHGRLASYRAGLEAGSISPVSIAKWLRRQGLMEVRDVA